MKNNEKLKSKLINNAFEENPTSSVNECTGLTPTPPLSDSEAESFTDIYNVPVSDVSGKGVQYKKIIADKKRFLKKL